MMMMMIIIIMAIIIEMHKMQATQTTMRGIIQRMPMNMNMMAIDMSEFVTVNVTETVTTIAMGDIAMPMIVDNVENANVTIKSTKVNAVNESSLMMVNDTALVLSPHDEFVTFYPDIKQLINIIVPLWFSIITIAGFCGNILVILVVLFNQQMHSITNVLIVNLAIADLLFVIFCIPFTAIDYVIAQWPFGDIWCRIVQYLIVVSAYASIYTLVLMSIDRFLAVVHPICSRTIRNEWNIKICLIVLWLIILTITAPVLVTHGVVYYDEFGVTFELCQFMQNDFLTPSAYQIAFFTSSYLIPLMIISGLYIHMIIRLWQHHGPQNASAIGRVRMSMESQRGRKRVTRLVLVVVVAFASLWLPVQMILLLKSLNLYQPTTTLKVTGQIVAQILAYTSSCINPILYAFLSLNFRKAFYKAINCTKQQSHCDSIVAGAGTGIGTGTGTVPTTVVGTAPTTTNAAIAVNVTTSAEQIQQKTSCTPTATTVA